MSPEIVVLDEKGNIISDIDFGIIPAGTTKELKIKLKNKGDVQLEELKVETDSEHVEVVCSNTELKPLQEILITLIAKVPEDIDDPIRPKITVRGNYLIS